jgi:hypothetical protein
MGIGGGDDSPASPSEKRKWCDLESVLDVTIKNADKLPLKPPVPRYLKEVMLGLQGGEADSRIQADLRRGAESILANKVAQLAQLLTGDSDVAIPVCNALFWMAIGIVFGRMHHDILSGFRDQLAQSWYKLTLELQGQIQNDREVRDWVLQQLPFVFAQAVYRLLCDAFEDDRKHFIGQSVKLLDKLSLVMHFEVTGFQVNSDTVRKTRKKLFLRNVLRNPQVDLFESEEAKRRQEMLESQIVEGKALSFGKEDGQALEETQLEHVMQGRNEPRQSRSPMGSSPSKSMKDSPDLRRASDAPDSPTMKQHQFVWEPWEPRENLSVERYDKLSGDGDDMWNRHMAELSQILGQEVEEPRPQTPQLEDDFEDMNEFDLRSTCSSPKSHRSYGRTTSRSSVPDSPKTPTRVRPKMMSTGLLNTPASAQLAGTLPSARAAGPPTVERHPPRTITMMGNQVTWPAKSPPKKPPPPLDLVAKPREQKSDSQSDDCVSLALSSPKLSKQQKRKVLAVGKLATMWKDDKDKKERDAKQKRIRQDALHRKIAAEPLPQDLFEHELLTTWVSPVMKRLANEEDRWAVLRKTRQESRQCKMHVSMPSLLRLSSKEEGTSSGNATNLRASTAPAQVSGRERMDSGQQGMTSSASRATKSTLLGASGSEQEGNSSFGSFHKRQTTPNARQTSGTSSNTPSGGKEARFVGGSKLLMLPGWVLPRVASAPDGTPIFSDMPPLSIGCALSLGPPSNLDKRVVESRLEAQGKAFRQTTFAQYMKENDIFTGEPKVRFDEARLKIEEESTLRKAGVSGPPKRQLRMQLRQLRK